ncbi:MAG: mannose-1-phosphate guanylyltransferase [Alloprevotella sp.]|nr:mannose-1-phosphate guanylyltransferase [Alloprevotella sp.]
MENKQQRKNAYCIILAGGIGRRLWPYSRQEKPKQFLDLLGTGRTLLQSTFDRIEKVFPRENIFISTFKDYRDHVLEQLPELPADNLLCEPVQLSSAPAVAWACLHIAWRCPEANILVTPCDHFIQNEAQFCADVERGLDFVAQSDALLALGVPATQPNTAYGYIQKGEEVGDGCYTVKSFTEKPSLDFARRFIESGEFIWNTGLFLWNARTISSLLGKIMPDVEEEIKARGSQISSDEVRGIVHRLFPTASYSSIDLIVLEKGENVLVQSCQFGWADIGNWNDLHAVEKKDGEGNAIIGTHKVLLRGSANNIVAVPEGMAAIVCGLEGYVVALEGNTLIVCPNNDPSLVKQLYIDTQITLGNEFV